MRILPILFLIIALLGCNSEKKSEKPNNDNRITEAEINKLFQDLEKNDYYQYVKDKEHIPIAQKLIKEGLLNSGGLWFPELAEVLIEQKGKHLPGENRLFAYRGFYLGGDYLFRGEFAYYLEKVKQMFEVRGLKLDFKDEDMFWREEDKTNDFFYFKHDIVINDSTYIVAEGNLREMGAQQYVERFLEIITIELEKQGHEDKFVFLSNPDSVFLLLISDKIKEVFENMPNSIKNKIVKLEEDSK